ncbi:IS3 family transposase [Streptomyces koyangensis]|uniref:IS3 family transposase n=1 Tax=Streptomyces koyangensis TaxID=188770 RepID=UPI0034553138
MPELAGLGRPGKDSATPIVWPERQVHTDNYRVYGARKIWRELNRQGHAVDRCTVERLMREVGIAGAVRGKRVLTTIPDQQADRAPDRVDRDFVAAAPNRCWVADFTHVATWAGMVYAAFVVDTFSRRIVGWSAATSKETRLVLDALEMALCQRKRDESPHFRGELIHHSDAGSRYTSFRLAETWTRLASRPRSALPGMRATAP